MGLEASAFTVFTALLFYALYVAPENNMTR